jgi:hypothetical protein
MVPQFRPKGVFKVAEPGIFAKRLFKIGLFSDRNGGGNDPGIDEAYEGD